MTLAEAIKNRESCLKYLEGNLARAIPENVEAVRMSLVALREQEARDADKAIFRRALDTYGAEAQTRMVFEEFAELQKELCKHARGKDNRMEIAEEIADVFNVLDQMIILYDCGDEVAAFRKEKLERLAEKLEEDV